MAESIDMVFFLFFFFYFAPSLFILVSYFFPIIILFFFFSFLFLIILRNALRLDTRLIQKIPCHTFPPFPPFTMCQVIDNSPLKERKKERKKTRVKWSGQIRYEPSYTKEVYEGVQMIGHDRVRWTTWHFDIQMQMQLQLHTKHWGNYSGVNSYCLFFELIWLWIGVFIYK